MAGLLSEQFSSLLVCFRSGPEKRTTYRTRTDHAYITIGAELAKLPQIGALIRSTVDVVGISTSSDWTVPTLSSRMLTGPNRKNYHPTMPRFNFQNELTQPHTKEVS